jgi:hypothetical protein
VTDPSTTGDSRRNLAAFAVLGAAQAGVYLALAVWQGYRTAPNLALALACVAFILYLGALRAARPLDGRRAFTIAVLLGLSFRLLLVPEPPFFSDDFFRYLWDGAVQLRGINPYRHAPADSFLAGIDDVLRARVNHPQVHTIYPPLAQLAFALNAALGGGWLGLKLLWLACDAAIAALVYGLVDPRRRLQLWTLYWWSPLVVLEIAWNAHLDLLGVLPVVAAVWLTHRFSAPSNGLGAAVAAATLAKHFPAALLPAAARSANPLRVTLTFVACFTLLYLPYLDAGHRLFSGLFTFASAWRFNAGLFDLAVWLTGSIFVVKIAAATVVLLVIAQSVRNRWRFERSAYWIIGVILVLSPTVHPWYLLWMIPLVAIRPSPAWLYLSGSVMLAYYGLGTYWAQGTWPEPWWLKLTIYGPFFGLLLRDAWRNSWWQAAWEIATRG